MKSSLWKMNVHACNKVTIRTCGYGISAAAHQCANSAATKAGLYPSSGITTDLRCLPRRWTGTFFFGTLTRLKLGRQFLRTVINANVEKTTPVGLARCHLSRGKKGLAWKFIKNGVKTNLCPPWLLLRTQIFSSNRICWIVVSFVTAGVRLYRRNTPPNVQGFSPSSIRLRTPSLPSGLNEIISKYSHLNSALYILSYYCGIIYWILQNQFSRPISLPTNHMMILIIWWNHIAGYAFTLKKSSTILFDLWISKISLGMIFPVHALR